jgi:predicted transcriptional regulator
MLPIHKNYSDLILSGEKTVEVRKRLLNEKAKRRDSGNYVLFLYETKNSGGCGKIVGEVQCYEQNPIFFEGDRCIQEEWEHYITIPDRGIQEKSCLNYDELKAYLCGGHIEHHIWPHEDIDGEVYNIDMSDVILPNGYVFNEKKWSVEEDGNIYGYYLKDPVKYETPKDISEFGLVKAPQGICYKEVK